MYIYTASYNFIDFTASKFSIAAVVTLSIFRGSSSFNSKCRKYEPHKTLIDI